MSGTLEGSLGWYPTQYTKWKSETEAVRQGCCLLIPILGQPVCVGWRCGKRTTQAIRAGTARSVVYGAVSCRSESSERSCPRQVRLYDSRQRGRIRSCVACLSGNGTPDIRVHRLITRLLWLRKRTFSVLTVGHSSNGTLLTRFTNIT